MSTPNSSRPEILAAEPASGRGEDLSRLPAIPAMAGISQTLGHYPRTPELLTLSSKDLTVL